jgi:predicted RNase H-like nuclease (RuvC/YqgF family)
VKNPYKVMRLWLKWESLDIAAMLEAIETKSELEGRRFSLNQRKQQKQRELDKLKSGKSSMKTMFKSQNSIVNTITNLTREIANSEKEIECYDIYIKTLIIQINHAAVPYFKKDKVGLYNDLINTYSESYINNS